MYIETYNSGTIYDIKINFLVDLEEKIGEQKIDLVIKRMLSPEILPIYEEARKTGVKLI